jgi:hypothetical protein
MTRKRYQTLRKPTIAELNSSRLPTICKPAAGLAASPDVEYASIGNPIPIHWAGIRFYLRTFE